MARLRRRTAGAAVGGLCLVLTCLGGGLPAHADDDLKDQQQQVESQLQATSEDLVGANASVRAAAATLADVSKNLPAAQSALAAAQSRYSAAKSENDALAGRLKAAQVAQVQTQREVNAAAGVVAARQRLVALVARARYAGAGLAEINSYISASGPAEFFDRAMLMRSVLKTTDQVIAETTVARQLLEKKKAMLDVVADQITSLHEQSAAALAKVQVVYAAAQAANAKVQGLVDQRAHALAVAGDYLKELQRRYDELQRKSEEIQSQLAARGSTSGPGVPGKGGLLWPANGEMTSPYGYRVDPYTGKRQLHAGIDIGASAGSNIFAARSGVVALVESTSQSGGYGNYTCIDHGGGFATCYAHQSIQLVHVGQSVAQGAVIGHVGSTGNSTGPHLHFETRINGSPVDPMQYY